MTSSTNKISIPKKIFENLFFKEGGTKEQMFKDNNIEHYILFPSDLKSEDFLLSIFNK
jgi:hypothetical protein